MAAKGLSEQEMTMVDAMGPAVLREAGDLVPGTSLRDQLAMAALTAITHPMLLARITQSTDVPAAVAQGAYRIADAMLAERSKGAAKAPEAKVATSGSGA